MSDFPAIEPSSVTAGDSIIWTKSLPDYPASSGWVLSYALRSRTTSVTITASASGINHLVSVPAATSAGWQAGLYSWQAYVSKGAERYTVATGNLLIRANLAAAGANYDPRSHCKRVLDAIEAVIEGRASTGDQQITIDGTQLVKMTSEQLIALRSRYLLWHREEQAAERIAAGLGSGRNIKMRFN